MHIQNRIAITAFVLFLCSFFSFANPALAATPSVVSGKITGPNTVALTYSEAVTSDIADYVSWSGALGSRTISAISGNGGNVITLTLNGSPLYGDAIGSVTINSTLRSVSTNSPISTTTVQIIDSQPPVLTYINVGSNTAGNSFAKNNSVINLSFSANESIRDVSATIMGHTVYPGGNGSGPYTTSYTVNSGDTADTVPVTLRFGDSAGNTAALSLTMTLTTAVSGNGTAAPVTTSSSGSGGVVTDPTATEAPSIYEVSRIISPSLTSTPSYTFFSNSAGTITYGGACMSNTTVAVRGNNTITFNPLANTSYSNCTIAVTNSFGRGNVLPVTVFSVNAAGGTTTNPGTGTVASATTGTTASPTPTIDPAYAQSEPGCRVGIDTVSPVTGRPCAAPSVPVSSPAAPRATPNIVQSTTYQFTLPLKLGSKGNEVLELQKRLVDEGYLTATPNGNFGPATEKAVKAFQKANGISPLGNVGPSTRAVLNQ